MFEIRRLDAQMAPALEDFFHALHQAGDEQFFHPHPMTGLEAGARASYRGDDIYYVIIEDGAILGYGFLRGWDEGFEVPSLGIAIHPVRRGGGLGRMFMHVLHEAARRRGASRVRLTVDQRNVAARSLYEDLGYVMELSGDGQLVGVLTLERPTLARKSLP